MNVRSVVTRHPTVCLSYDAREKRMAVDGAVCLSDACPAGSCTKANGQAASSPVEVDEKIRRLIASDFPTLTNDIGDTFLREWGATQEASVVTMRTTKGDVVLELFSDVPVHRANFLYKVYRGYYDPCEFTRVVPDFVVQGGNSEDERPQQLRFLIGKHTLMPEVLPHRIHTRGALAMSRSYSNNPDKRSSSYDFYIVTGRQVGARELFQVGQETGFVHAEAQKEQYATVGGAPHLDGEHTVFGRVIEGMDVVDALAATPRDGSDWPVVKLSFTMDWEDVR